MPVITVQDVRDVVSVAASDAAIELQIEVVGDVIGQCLDTNYGSARAKAIMIYTVAHFAEKGAPSSGGIKSRKWADGSSESYNTDGIMGGSSSFWDAAAQLDTADCLSAFGDANTPGSSSPVFVVTGRASKCYGGPV